MGYIAEPTPEMGPYSVETRSESFRLYAEDGYDYVTGKTDEEPEHLLYISPLSLMAVEGRENIGTVEVSISAIPYLRAALDQVEAIHNGASRPSENSPKCPTCNSWMGEGDHSHPPSDFSTVMFPSPPPESV